MIKSSGNRNGNREGYNHRAFCNQWSSAEIYYQNTNMQLFHASRVVPKSILRGPKAEIKNKISIMSRHSRMVPQVHLPTTLEQPTRIRCPEVVISWRGYVITDSIEIVRGAATDGRRTNITGVEGTQRRLIRGRRAPIQGWYAKFTGPL